MKAATLSKRRILRHPALWFKAERAAGRISAMPALSSTFIEGITAGEDFIVRYEGRRSRIQFDRNKDGSLTAFASPQFSIELIGTNKQRYDRAVAAMRKRTKSSKRD